MYAVLIREAKVGEPYPKEWTVMRIGTLKEMRELNNSIGYYPPIDRSPKTKIVRLVAVK